jgi:chromosome segregation ATPase
MDNEMRAKEFTPKDIHKVADSKGIKWDNEPSFLKLTKQLDSYRDEVKILINFLQEKMTFFEKYKDDKVKTIKDKTDIAEVTKEITSKIEEIEVEELKIQKKIQSINEELEKLRQDEEILYKTIKERYPDLSDDQIVKEIHSNLI